MKIVPEILDKDAHREFDRFLEATGRSNWNQKLEKTNSRPFFKAPSPNAYLKYLANLNPLTHHIETYLALHKAGKVLRRHATPELMKVCGYLKIANGLIHETPSYALSKLESVWFDDETIRGFLFELDIAIHFFRCACDVQFIDLWGLGNFDLLISNGQQELEVECKTKSVDAGRKITRGNFYLLCDVLPSQLAPFKESYAVFFKCDGRLSESQQLFSRVSDEIAECMASEREDGEVEGLRFELRKLSPGLQIRTDEEAAMVLAPRWSPQAHYFVLSNRETFIIGCESADTDRVLKSIYEDLKKGASQLSKSRPSLLACQIRELEDDSWDKLASNSGLAQWTGRLLRNPERNHVNYVTYSSDRTPPKRTGAVTSFAATNLWFTNKASRFPNPESIVSPGNTKPG